ncbi:hypothetical protein PLESTF_000771500 [Pleodorina starrii]|nr:hypothetical protein PLESTF_000771500 [Pleodorina starrii]
MFRSDGWNLCIFEPLILRRRRAVLTELSAGNLLQAIQGLPGRSQPRCPVHLLTYASEVARGVAALHRCGVHHGSLTPSAVLLVPSDQTPAATPPPPPPPSNPSDRRPVPPPLVVPGAPLSTAAKPAPGVLRCKLALYGLVHPVEHAGRLASNAAGWGALSYLAPECFTADPATVTQEMLTRMDAHAFGALCYHLFVGAAPYHQYHAAQVLVGLTAGGLQLTWPADLPPDGHRPAGQCRPPVPEPIRQLVSRCLDRNPEARPDFPEIVAILESIRRECEGQPS